MHTQHYPHIRKSQFQDTFPQENKTQLRQRIPINRSTDIALGNVKFINFRSNGMFTSTETLVTTALLFHHKQINIKKETLWLTPGDCIPFSIKVLRFWCSMVMYKWSLPGVYSMFPANTYHTNNFKMMKRSTWMAKLFLLHKWTWKECLPRHYWGYIQALLVICKFEKRDFILKCVTNLDWFKTELCLGQTACRPIRRGGERRSIILCGW